MAEVARFVGDVIVVGQLFAQGFTSPAASVNNDAIQAGADIDATKLEQERGPVVWLGTYTEAAAAKRVPIHRARGEGTVIEFVAGVSQAAAAASNAVVTLRKNGSAILTGSVTLDDTVAAYATVTGTLSDTTLAAGDVLEAEIVSVTGTPPKGVWVQCTTREEAA